MSRHLFVQDADEEEPLAGGQSMPSLVRIHPVTLLQSLKALEALMSWAKQRNSVSWQKAGGTEARHPTVGYPLTKASHRLSVWF